MRKFVVGLLAAAIAFSGCAPSGRHIGARPHASLAYQGHLVAHIFRHHHQVAVRDLGYGTVTNLGVYALANDYNWAAPSGAAINTLKLSHFCITGTGTSAAATDYKLGTYDSVAAVNGTQSGPTLTTTSGKYVVTCTQSYTGTEAVTEFGLINSSTVTATTGTPFTAGTTTTGTVTSTPLTASSSTVQGQQETVCVDTTSNILGLVVSNTTSVVTIPTSWLTSSTDATTGTVPVNTDSLTFYALLFDHLTFSAINVVNGDQIAFTFTLTLPSGS